AFNNLGKLVADGRADEAVAQLVAASECDEVGLGNSATKTGRRISPEKARDVLRLFEIIPQYASTGFRHFEEIQLFIDGINKDRISDIACNFIKSHLVDYTQAECREHGIPVETVEIANVYNPSTASFQTVSTE